jgi:transcriptional regulator with XRE-family HTH domain
LYDSGLSHIPKSKIRRVVGQAIRKHRERLKLTQEALAEKADTHRTYLADIERGTRNPSIETIRRLALGLGVPISEVFKTAEIGSFDEL